MGKELIFPSDRIKFPNSRNCLIGTIGAVFSMLSPDQKISPKKLEAVLKRTNDYYLFNALELLIEENLMNFTHDVIEISKRRRGFFSAAESAISGGAIVETAVLGLRWAKEVVGDTNTDHIKDDELHSVLIYGYYHPEPSDDLGWFYIADPYDQKLRFIGYQEFFKLLPTDDGKIWLNLFDLCLDHASLLTRHRQVPLHNGNTQQSVLNLLSGRTKREKIKSLFKRK